MRESRLVLANYFLFWLSSLVLIGFQSTLWLQVFGYFPSPHFWAPTLIYWTLFRRAQEGLVMTYLLALTACTLSAMPLGLMLLLFLLLFVFVYFLRLRIFWEGPTYFMMVCGLSAALTPVFHYACSWLFENNPIRDFHFFDWILRSLITALFALPLYFLFSWFDSFTQKEQPKDTGSQFA